MRSAIVIALLALAGCATMPPAAAKCEAKGLTGFVGKPLSSALQTRAQRRSDARSVRVIRPGEMVTMDYRADRLNIHVDPQGRVTRMTCS